MKFLKLLFNRFVFVTLSILLQIVFTVLLVVGLMDYWIFIVISVVLSFLVFLNVTMRDINPAQQLLWITVILIFPVGGIVLYLMIGDAKWSRRAKRRMRAVLDKQIPEINSLSQYPERYAGQINYLKNKTKTSAYAGCKTLYFPTGERYLKALLEDLERAKKFIFLEFFIISEGRMWGSVLSVLERKVKEGVEVRVMYDDIGSTWKIPASYYKGLRKKGIKCVRFNRYLPFVTNLHNNRDHRKIVIIDGIIAYTGGINLADEYINEAGNDFFWKDTGVRIEGNAVNEFTEMFLQLYGINDIKCADRFEDYSHNCHMDSGEGGVVVPFGTGPSFFYTCPVAEEAILNMIAGASKELIITTPYLIVDYSINRALAIAVARGVDVKIVIPDVPDKKLVYMITRNNAEYLHKNGVKIYKSTGSFIHAKSVVADGEVAIVGTINLDYRSFLHHFENAVWMYGTDAVKELKADVDELCCDKNRISEKIGSNAIVRFVAAVMKIFTPLF
ncbi:MAG: cardiolipin synthase [Clostridia bacterium]|nr:cardiolipin synthase [Clostridia bacterium]